MVGILLCAFLAAIGLNWPELPFNARAADVIFIPLAIAVIATRVPRMTWHRSDTAVAIYLLGALPAIAVSADQRHSAIEFVRQLYLVAIYIVIAIVARRGLAALVGTGLALGGAVLSYVGLLFVAVTLIGARPWPLMGEVMTLPYVGHVLRVRALTASEAMLASVLTVAVPFAITSCTSLRSRGWCRHAVVMCVAALLTLSHAVAGFVVSFAIAAWPSLTKWPRRIAAVGAVIVFLGLNFAATASIRSISYGATSYSDPSQYHYAVDRKEISVGELHVTYDVMSYARLKQVAWGAFTEHPIAGVGLDQFHSVTRRAFEEGRLTAPYREIDPHSTLPGRLAETGIIGGVTLLVLLFVWARMAIDLAPSNARGAAPSNARGAAPNNIAAAAAFAGLIVVSINADIMNFRFLWVIAGLMRGLQASTPSPQGGDVAQPKGANGIAIASGRDVTVTDGTD